MENIFNALNAIQNGRFVRVMSMTDVTLVRPKSKDNPFYGKEVKKLQTITYQFAINYQKIVNKRMKDKGIEGTFVADENKVGKSVIIDKVLWNENKQMFYGQFYSTPKSNTKAIYYINGKQASAEEVKLIKAWTKSSYSVKQAEHGLVGKEQVQPRSMKLSNILWVKCGSIEAASNAFENIMNQYVLAVR